MKRLFVFAAMAATLCSVSCTKELKQEIADLKQQVESLTGDPLVLTVENDSFNFADTKEMETTRKVSIPYSVTGAKGEVTVSYYLNRYYSSSDHTEVVLVQETATTGTVNITSRSDTDSGMQDDGIYINYPTFEIVLTATDKAGRAACKSIRVGSEGWWIEVYQDSKVAPQDGYITCSEQFLKAGGMIYFNIYRYIDPFWNQKDEAFKTYTPASEELSDYFYYRTTDNWITVAMKKEDVSCTDTGYVASYKCEITAAANTTGAERTAKIYFPKRTQPGKEGGTIYGGTIKIIQQN